jgi:glycosyltransferase involved in cell wall biosynthesis
MRPIGSLVGDGRKLNPAEVDLLGKSSLVCYPMHGYRKLLDEGYRTRDGHLIEWFSRLLENRGPIVVVSRPEPALARVVARRRAAAGSPVSNTVNISPLSWRIPDVRNRRRWWLQSIDAYPRLAAISERTPAIIWNPMIALSSRAGGIFNGTRTVMFDLLDDWTKHYAFKSIRSDVTRAYREAFARADVVSANSEGTVELAKRFGREDAVLLPNGCDPNRFSATSKASGRGTVGYVGKIGRRLDLDLIENTARMLPQLRFVFAGPILDAEYLPRLRNLNNVELLGDVHYSRVPNLLAEFDVGWVPHRVGEFEVGGDIIKTYEYRAAGLPVLSTPLIGAGRREIDGIAVRDASEHGQWLKNIFGSGERVERSPCQIPVNATWEAKAKCLLAKGQVLGRR